MSSDRLNELRVAADRRRRTMPSYPDSPEEIAERAADALFWAKLQVKAWGRLDEEEV